MTVAMADDIKYPRQLPDRIGNRCGQYWYVNTAYRKYLLIRIAGRDIIGRDRKHSVRPLASHMWVSVVY